MIISWLNPGAKKAHNEHWLPVPNPLRFWSPLLQDAQNLTVVAQRPWQLIPGGFVVITVLMFNFIGDGLRDAADPYTRG